MNQAVVIIGVGEIGGVFARGFLKSGHPVYPITRNISLADAYKEIFQPKAVVVGVGEKDFDIVMKGIPKSWQDSLILIQNELLPKDWQRYAIKNPTVISVWFEKKYPYDFKVIIPSPVYGPQADLVIDALASLGVSSKKCGNEEELLFELVLKNLYILTTNIAGLKVGGNVGELWKNHESLMHDIANDVLDIQFYLISREFNRDRLIAEMVKAFEGDLTHKCMGRSASARLDRALKIAAEAGLSVKHLNQIKSVAQI